MRQMLANALKDLEEAVSCVQVLAERLEESNKAHPR